MNNLLPKVQRRNYGVAKGRIASRLYMDILMNMCLQNKKMNIFVLVHTIQSRKKLLFSSLLVFSSAFVPYISGREKDKRTRK